MNLIPAESISDWEDSSSSGSWSINKQGHIIQTGVIDDPKNTGGGKLVHTGYTLGEETEIHCQFIPGSSYETGMVFEYRDDQNCSIVFVDLKSGTRDTWSFVVCRVSNGRVRYLSKEDHDEEAADAMTITVRNEDENLGVYLNDTLMYSWLSKQLEPGTHVGLYSNRSTDAIYQSLSSGVPIADATQEPDAEQTPPHAGDNPVPPNAVPADGKVISVDQSVEEVNRFLSLNKPSTESVIEFKRGYRVSLDSLYSSIYLYSELKRPREITGSNKTSKSVTLDYRPRRWYGEYKNITKSIELCENDVKRHETVLSTLENNGAYPNDVDKYEHDAQISLWRQRYMVSQDKLERLLNEKNNLLTEMRIAGYMVRTKDVPTELQDLGFDFYLVSGIAGYSDFDPIDIDPFADLKVDKTWKEIEARLKDRLFKNVRFSERSKERYEAKTPDLKTQTNFQPLIQGDLDAIDSEIKAVENQISNAEQQLTDYDTEIKKWKDDKSFLQSQVVNFRAYSSGEYPIGGGGLGPQNSQNFKNFLSGPCRNALKSFNYYLNVNGTNFSVRINQYSGFGWSHDYAYWTSYKDFYRTETTGWWLWKETKQVFDYRTYYHHYSFGADGNVRNFFDVGIRVCDHYINTILPGEIAKTQKRIATLKNNKVGLELKKSDLQGNGLKLAREEFLDKWNRSDVIESTVTGEKLVDPNADPLIDLLADLETDKIAYKVYHVNLENDGYYTQDGQALQKFLSVVPKLPHTAVLILPVFDQNDQPLAEVRNAVVNPVRSSKVARLPTITFVETYQTSVRWSGYALGELTQTINLFPGESKQLVLESVTNKRVIETTGRDEQTEREGIEVSTFESELSNEMARADAAASSRAEANASSRKQQVTDIVSDSHTDSDTWSIGASLSIPLGPVTAGLTGGYSNTVSDTHTVTKSDALSIFQSSNLQKANKESKESFKKEINNTVKRVASETSNKNRVSFMAVTNSEISTSESRKETILIENPNVGRTVNYHFFQLQNTYETSTDLVDVKIVLDPGVELMQHSEITDLRIYDLEEFTKIYANSDEKDPRSAIMSVIVARQVIKNYMNTYDRSDIGSSLVSTDALPIDEGMLDVLNLSSAWSTKGNVQDNIVNSFKDALSYLKSRNFRFSKTTFIEPDVHTVNTGSYYMDSEVGRMPATETYLEERRDLEAEFQRAGLEHMRAQTNAGVFYPNLSNVNALSVDRDLNHLGGNGQASKDEPAVQPPASN